MRGILVNLKKNVKQKAASIMLFGYCVIAGTSAPLLLSRCGTNCANCGYCGLALGILPLVFFVTMRSRIKRAGKQAQPPCDAGARNKT